MLHRVFTAGLKGFYNTVEVRGDMIAHVTKSVELFTALYVRTVVLRTRYHRPPSVPGMS